MIKMMKIIIIMVNKKKKKKISVLNKEIREILTSLNFMKITNNNSYRKYLFKKNSMHRLKLKL